ncbi:MAG: hypothetical protein BGO31_12935 [Bacteroidetes bacterium 43-16]|nr:MAG: hypothetical protein BGO31_12935 [Bacteroidetes bacterium 43-16]
MKKISLLIMLACFASIAFAGGDANIRKNCTFWKKRYKSSARISIGIPICYSSNASCNGNFREYLHPMCDKDCGFQEAWAGPGGLGSPPSGTYGYIKKRICSRGEVIDDLGMLLLPEASSNAAANADNIEESLLTVDAIEFIDGSRTVQLQNLSGYATLQKNNGFKSELTVSIWLPTDDEVNQIEDTTMDANEVIRQLKIQVTDNGVVINGNLYNADLQQFFIISESASQVKVAFTGLNLNVPIPASIPFDNIAVRLSGDGLPDNQTNMQTMSANTQLAIDNKDVVFNAYPNPTSNQLNIEFSNSNEGGKTSIMLFDVTGRKIQDIFNGDLAKNEKRIFTADLSRYPDQTYFIYIESGGTKLIRKVMKN